MGSWAHRIYACLSSVRLTVALLALAVVLVFWGTMAQVTQGLYKAQNEFFRSFFVYWQPAWSAWRVPIFPGGYLLGWLMVANLLAAHFRYYQPSRRKIGIVLIHSGILVLLVGQLLTDLLAVESQLHLRHGETKNYSEASREFELAIVDTTTPERDTVVAISQHRLARGGDVEIATLPFTVRIREYLPNSSLTDRPTEGYRPIPATTGFGTGLWWRRLPLETDPDRRDVPSAVVELVTREGSLGRYVVSGYFTRPHELTHDGRTYRMELRQTRYYKPFFITLLEFRHDRYPGTEIPKNFSSRIRIVRPATGEDREVLIYMNNPLRYFGETYYQASFDPDDQGTVLQVVRNPSWLAPYFGCVIVTVGMMIQFGQHLTGWLARRRPA
ncbi:MAG: cytochrome c biogenesis protein ResB [Verrucomicrobiae bacterium]|nr:cytochrome c biogenesis protein ResB [Verrucomicrobiae bacterium]